MGNQGGGPHRLVNPKTTNIYLTYILPIDLHGVFVGDIGILRWSLSFTLYSELRTVNCILDLVFEIVVTCVVARG